MPIQVPAHAHIVKFNADALAISVSQGHSFIDDPAVSRRPLQSITQYFRGGRHIIKQSNLPKIGLLSKMKSEMIILHGLGDKVQKADLIFDHHANVWIFDLVQSEARFLQKQLEVNSCLLCPCVGETRYTPHCARGSRMLRLGDSHSHQSFPSA